MRIASFLGRALLALGLLAGPAAAEPGVVLDGTYRGTGASAGMVLRIAPDAGGFALALTDASGQTQEILADRVGDMAETALRLRGEPTILQIQPQPYGAEVAMIPVSAEGRLEPRRGRLSAFLRAGLVRKTLPEGYLVAPPEGSDLRMTGVGFVRSYVWWRPREVVRGYRALAPRHRTLMRLFPAVQLDVIWRLCLAPRADGVIGTALRGSGVTCGEVVDGLARGQRRGRYPDFRAAVADQTAVLVQAMRCARAEVFERGVCDRSARQVSEAAIALDTPGSVLARYR